MTKESLIELINTVGNKEREKIKNLLKDIVINYSIIISITSIKSNTYKTSKNKNNNNTRKEIKTTNTFFNDKSNEIKQTIDIFKSVLDNYKIEYKIEESDLKPSLFSERINSLRVYSLMFLCITFFFLFLFLE